MKLQLAVFAALIASSIAPCHCANEDSQSLVARVTPTDRAQVTYENVNNRGDLSTSASDRTFHLTKDYPGGYPIGYPYGALPDILGYVYPSYRGGGGGGNLIPGYRGFNAVGAGRFPGGGGGHTGYGYYGNPATYPRSYSGYGGDYGGYGGGYGGYGYSGYGNSGDYGISGAYGPASYGSYGLADYNDGSLGREGYDDRYDDLGGYDNGYGYGRGYGSTYAARNPINAYNRAINYGGTIGNPTGYRGYS